VKRRRKIQEGNSLVLMGWGVGRKTGESKKSGKQQMVGRKRNSILFKPIYNKRKLGKRYREKTYQLGSQGWG